MKLIRIRNERIIKILSDWYYHDQLVNSRLIFKKSKSHLNNIRTLKFLEQRLRVFAIKQLPFDHEFAWTYRVINNHQFLVIAATVQELDNAFSK